MEELSDAQWRQGYLLAALLLVPANAIHRRVEYIEFLPDGLVRRRVSLDIEVTPDAETPQLLPLAFLDKELIVGFDLRGPDGGALPLATWRDNAQASLSVLAVVAEAVLGARPRDSLLRQLRELIEEGDPWEAASKLRAVRQDPTGVQLLMDPTFLSLAQACARRFLLLTPYPTDQVRQVIKFSYVQRIRRRERDSGLGLIEAGRQWIRAAFESALRSLALRPLDFVFELGGSGVGVSHHVEVIAPLGLTLSHSRCWRPAHRAASLVGERHLRTRSHFHVPEGIGLPERWLLYADMRPPRDDFVWGAFLSTMVVALVLTFLVVEPFSAETIDPGLSVLLALPGLVALAIARQQEHPLRSVMLLGLRGVVAASGLLLFGFLLDLAVGGGPICLVPLAGDAMHDCLLRPTPWWAAGGAWLLWASTLPAFIRGTFRR